MINVKEIKYTIEPIEINEVAEEYNWKKGTVKAWLGLGEIESIPSVFIQLDDIQMAIAVNDLETLINMPIVQKLKDSYEPPRIN